MSKKMDLDLCMVEFPPFGSFPLYDPQQAPAGWPLPGLDDARFSDDVYFEDAPDEPERLDAGPARKYAAA
ncbi:MAG TPA: hypothetical protein VMV79_04465 [Alphaproteobacteria bacterium]|nr:hypothetical protein [Alphaproteobacteria bacterium]